MKREIKIWSQDLEFLVKHVSEAGLQAMLDEARRQMPTAKPANPLVLAIDDDETELLMDSLSTLLTSAGIGSDGKINALGSQIERMIDIIAPA